MRRTEIYMYNLPYSRHYLSMERIFDKLLVSKLRLKFINVFSTKPFRLWLGKFIISMQLVNGNI
ncbi:hypothetical protein V1478_012047 [Vespula squamosa]|uniref:Maturase K n=1 Tax=Vespula squamosa TaxID=30214 RepID=A0ABD2AC65_VESSQ